MNCRGKNPLLYCAVSQHPAGMAPEVFPTLCRSSHHRNHPKASLLGTVASMPTTFSSLWRLKYLMPMSAVFVIVSPTMSPNKP